MKSKSYRIILLAILLLLLGFIIFCIAIENPTKENNLGADRTDDSPRQPIGGGCGYLDYAGTCRVVGISKTDESIQQVQWAGYEGYEIRYKFEPLVQINYTGGYQNQVFNMVRSLKLYKIENDTILNTGIYPGKDYIAKYGINETTSWECIVKAETRGSCNPDGGVSFDRFDLSDSFEMKLA